MPKPRLYPFINRCSGKNIDEDLEGWLRQNIPAERLGQITVVESTGEFAAAQRRALELCRQDNGLLVLSGGDGTVNGFLPLLAGSGQAFALLPSGTFNFFARDHAIPEDRTAALKLALDGSPAPTAAGWINDTPFIVSVGLGLHPHIIEQREQVIARFGRNRLVATLSSFWTAARFFRPMHAVATDGSSVYQIQSPIILISLSGSQLGPAGVPGVSSLRREQMLLCYLKIKGWHEMLGTLMAGITGRLGQDPHLVASGHRELELSVRLRRRVKVCIDGEVQRFAVPLRIRLDENALSLVCIPASSTTVPQDREQRTEK